jgi:hypothetical protein
MVDITITGADQIAAVSNRLKEAGNKGKRLEKELRAAVAKEAKPIGRYIAVSAGSNLPNRGGLGYTVGGANISVNVNIRRVRVSLKAKGYDLAAMDRGRLRHPVFGNRRIWETQQVKPKLFTTPFKESAPQVRVQIMKAMDDIAKRIEG